MSKTFINTNWTERDYEVTNIVACIADEAPAPHFKESNGDELPSGIDMLYIEHQNSKRVEYWGYL